MLTRIIPLTLLAALGMAADVSCPRLVNTLTIDGDLADWKVSASLSMSTPPVDDLHAERAVLAWDDTGISFGLAMRDRTLHNLGTGDGIAKGDCADLRLVLPDRRVIRLLVSPVTVDGGPAMYLSSRSEVKGPLTQLAAATDPKADANGVAWAVRSDATGWTVEAMVPWKVIGYMPAAGTTFPFVVVGWDRDQPDDWKVWHGRSESANQKKEETWPKLVLAK